MDSRLDLHLMSSLRRNDDDPKQPFRTVFLSHIINNGYGVYCYGNRKFMHLHVNYNKERD